MTYLAYASLAAWLYLAALHGRFWSAGPELAAAAPRDAPAVDVVVPARDEAAFVAASVGSLLAQDYAGPLCVTLVDDGSTDGTGEIARALPGAVVVTSARRPAGWAGKLWAVAQGVDHGGAPWLLMTDADIVHDPRHLATLVAHAERHGLDMVSEMVALRCEAPAERLLIPAFVYFFQLLFPFARVNAGRIAAAAGGTVLVRRAALQRAGGIAAIRDQLIDDVALARAVKAAGGRLWLGHTRMARSVRPYPHAADVWRMVARSAYVQLGCSPWLLVGSLLGLGLLFVVPEASFSRPGAVVYGVTVATFLPTQLRTRPGDWWLAPLLPLVAVFYMAATVGSAWAHHRGRGVVWKARSYARSGV